MNKDSSNVKKTKVHVVFCVVVFLMNTAALTIDANIVCEFMLIMSCNIVKLEVNFDFSSCNFVLNLFETFSMK